MISKERLQELINEGATIYSKNVLSYSLIKPYTYTIMDGTLYQVIGTKQISTCPIEKLENLYETKEQAKWSLKYHVTRTEELDLPTWEEFITDDKYKYHYGLLFFDFDNYRLVACIPTEDDNTEFIGIDVDRNTELYHWDKATEENYTKACDLCVKLFGGEKKNE